MPPNLLLFLPETLRADAFFGPEQQCARTPHFDSFAQNAAVFTQAYAQMAYCTPSRCSMFTGLYPHTHNHRSIWDLLQPGERNLFLDLKEAGYHNVVFGKNDLIDASWAQVCFDEYQPRYATRRGNVEGPPDDGPLSRMMYGGRRTGDWFDRDEACIQSALDFLDHPPRQPWCLFLPLSFAHPTYAVEEPWFSLHDREQMPEPIAPPTGPRRPHAEVLEEFHGADAMTAAACREVKAVYYGMIARVDQQFGAVMERLAERGLGASTIAVFLSDHGDYAGDYGMVEKFMGAFQDCLLNVPLAMAGPGVEAGEFRALCELTDLYPTLMELLGLQPQHYQCGRSLMPLMRGECGEHRDTVFAEGGRNADEEHLTLAGLSEWKGYYGQRVRFQAERANFWDRALMARTPHYKYVYSTRYTGELYALDDDPNGTRNLVQDPGRAEIVAGLRERCLRWLVETSDTTPMVQTGRGWPAGSSKTS